MLSPHHRHGRVVAVAATLVLLLGALTAAPALAVDGQSFVSLSNANRAQRGKPPVAWLPAVDTIVVERANQMARRDRLEHDLAYVQRRLDELGVCYTGYGEIIYWERGYGSFDPARAVEAWYTSTSGHREIMLGDYDAASGSWARNSSSGGVFAVMVFVNVCGTVPTTTDPGEAVRVNGADRYATAAALSKASFGAGVPVVFVATGANFPDALAAGPAAAKEGGPVLLVGRGSIPSVTAAELDRLDPGRIVVLGAAGAVSDAVVQALHRYTTGSVKRVSGADRYATAGAVSATFFQKASVVYVATGANFPDALSGGATAGKDRGPILLVKRDEVPKATADELRRLKPSQVVVLGSSAVVSDQVASQLGRLSGGSVQRVAGADRYATAVKASQAEFGPGEPSTVYVATGAAFPDGLTASPVAATVPGPLLLVKPTELPSTVASELKRLAPDKVVVLGSTGAVSSAVVSAINAVVP
ncbi:MAG TPA: cell wall-binding repeat-containing protein [candidate division Zixibacteria bacterium]|nr:cell wall-binding repeat-containing protein [candidate division Zixibacteria bacterium]